MNFSIVFLVFATAFVFVHCNDVRSERDVNFTNVVPVDCSIDHLREHVSALRNVTCKPYYKHVDLNPMPGQQLSPSAVFVRRCYGQADPDTVCAPKSTEIFHVHVSINSSSQQIQCGVVMVEEHLSCEIKCKQGPESCNAKQEYIQSACRCRCKNRKELKRNCDALDGRVWDDENCECTCIPGNRACVTGSMWDNEHCRCSRT